MSVATADAKATAKPAKAVDTAAAVAAPAAPVAAVAAPAAPETLRKAQVRKLTTGNFKPVGHFSEPQQALLPAEWDFDDAVKPEFWGFIAPSMQANAGQGSMQDRVGTVIEVRSVDHAFYGLVYVKGLRRNAHGQADALDVVCIGPVYDAVSNTCYPIDLKTGGRWLGRRAVKA